MTDSDTIALIVILAVCVYGLVHYITHLRRSVETAIRNNGPAERKALFLKLAGYSILTAPMAMVLGIMLYIIDYAMSWNPVISAVVIILAIGVVVLFLYGILNLARAFRAREEEKASAGKASRKS